MRSASVTPLHYLEIRELANAIRTGEVSPVALTRTMLERIAAVDPHLHAYARLTPEQALAQASAAEEAIARGDYRGPLHGVPVAVKDLFWTAGVVTAAGTTVHAGFVPSEDATVVRRLREAGAILLGKLQLTEGAFATHHPSVEAPLNPWGAEHWPGASSSGSGVATAAGLCFASLGTDSGGSIRFPCAANGLTGLKPTWGRISRHGCFELAATLDHVGPIARSAADVKIVFEAIAGHDHLDPTSLPHPAIHDETDATTSLAGLRIGIDYAWNALGSDEATQQALENVIRTMHGLDTRFHQVSVPDAWPLAGQWEAHCGVQTAVAHAATYPSRRTEYGPALTRLIEIGRGLDGMAYQRLRLAGLAFTGRVDTLMETVDLLLVPVQPFAAPTHEQLAALAADPELNQRLIQYTAPFNISGHPSLTLPCGMTPAGMPIGCQLIGRKGGESTLLRAGITFQQQTSWHLGHPRW